MTTQVKSLPNVNTFGWHTVYAASFPVVNSAIMAEKSFPDSFNFKDKVGVTISGTWKSWQLIAGGSGGNVQMECVVQSGTVKGLNQPDGDLKDASLIIQVRLRQVADAGAAFRDPTAKEGSGTAHVLKVNDVAEGDDPVVSVLQSSKYPNVRSEIFQDILGSVFAHYFCANISDFNHTFSIMMLNEEADNGNYSWLKPSAFSYAVGGPVSGDLSENVFGVLCMVDGAGISSRQQQTVDIGALQGLTDGANSAFLISPEKLTEHMLFNGAVSTIQGSRADDFRIGSDGVSISNVEDITWGNFQTDGGVISPKIGKGNFTLSIKDNHILLELIDVQFEASAGITVHMSITQKFGYKTVQRSDGKYVFVADDNTFGSPHIVSEVEVSKGLRITEIVLAVVGLVASLGLGISAVGSALSAGASASEEAGVATVEISADTIESAVQGAGESAVDSAESDAAASVDAGVASGEAGQVQSGSFLLSNTFRAYAGIAAAIAGIPAAGIAVATYVVSDDYDNIPAFNDFADNCIGASKWPAMANAELVSVDLRNSLVIGIKLS